MNFLNSDVLLYSNHNSAYHLNIVDIIKNFKVEKTKNGESFTQYKLIDELYIDSFKNGKIELNKINSILIKPYDETEVQYLNLNDDYNFISNILCCNTNKKNYFIQPIDKLNNTYAVQNQTLKHPHITFKDDIHLTLNFGYIIGYWLLRGGFYKINGKEHLSWSGRESDISNLKDAFSSYTYIAKAFKEDLQMILLIENKIQEVIINNFCHNKLKSLPDWLFLAKQDFIQGLLYGLIASNSYISSDTKNNFYLAIKITNPKLIGPLHNLFKFRLNIYSRIIGDNNHLSFKFNKKLYDFITNGIVKKLINIPQIEEIQPVINKEIIINSFKLVPWYKFKTVNHSVKISHLASLELKSHDPIMLSNGIFTNI